jgi:hypothetical protein
MGALTASGIRSVLLRHDGLPGLLQNVATPDERRQLYAELGISLTYERRTVGGKPKELVRPSLSVPCRQAGPWSNPACLRGDLNPTSLRTVAPQADRDRPGRWRLCVSVPLTSHFLSGLSL